MSVRINEDLVISVSDVVDIARQADAAILEVYSNRTQWNVTYKEGNEPLTAADQASNKIICENLNKISKGAIPIVSEENVEQPFEERKNFEYFWCVDPLDGTKEFLQQNGEFTVNIALCRGNRPILGVVTVPVRGSVYWAVEGFGSFKQNSLSESAEKLICSPFSVKDVGLGVIGSRHHSTEDSKRFMGFFKDPKIVEMGSSLKFMLVAEGSAHVYPRLAPTREWDSCASQIIVEESGGKVLRIPSGVDLSSLKIEDYLKMSPVVYNKQNLLNPFFVVLGNCQEFTKVYI